MKTIDTGTHTITFDPSNPVLKKLHEFHKRRWVLNIKSVEDVVRIAFENFIFKGKSKMNGFTLSEIGIDVVENATK